VALTVSYPVLAGDLAVGQKKAGKCKVCHGADGIAKIPNAPNIGGESKFYLTKQLKAFRAGEREDLQMSTIAKKLTDEDIDDLSEYYSSINIMHTIPDING
jgi:cytochrome c553